MPKIYDNHYIYEVSRVSIINDEADYYRYAQCRESRIALCNSIKAAEDIIRLVPGDYWPTHSYIVRIMPTDTPVDDYSVDGEYVYDSGGRLLDKWEWQQDSSSFKPMDETGHRFRVGDICEVLWADMRPHPAIVAQLPPDRETIARAVAAAGYFDGNEYAYHVVLIDEKGRIRDQDISLLRVFEPHVRIHPATERRLRRSLDDFRTLPVRQAIERTAYEQRLLAITSSVGLDDVSVHGATGISTDVLRLNINAAALPAYCWPEEGRVKIRIRYRQIDRHPEMIREGLRRLMGLPAEGRAYHLKELWPAMERECPEFLEYYF